MNYTRFFFSWRKIEGIPNILNIRNNFSIFEFRKASRLNSTSNASGLDEYVDILQVQQLLLDSSSSSPSTIAAVTPATSSGGQLQNSAACTSYTARHRPRVNIQKANEYSSLIANTATASTTAVASGAVTTPTTQIQGRIHFVVSNNLEKEEHANNNNQATDLNGNSEKKTIRQTVK